MTHKKVTNDEHILLQRLQSGEEQALGALMQLFYTELYDYACKFTGDEPLIRDCIQEVLISLWQRRDTATTISAPKYYLLRAVKNKVLKALHQNYKTTTFDTLAEYDFKVEFSIESMIVERQVSEENAARLQQLLFQLPARQKEIIYLKFFHQLDPDQIAALMNISRQSVYNLLYESLQKLRAFWHQEFIASMVSLGFFISFLF